MRPRASPAVRACAALYLTLVGCGTQDGPWARCPEAIAGLALPLDLPELNARVVGFAAMRQGQRVGEGECTDLAAAALGDAGASTFSEAHSGLDDDYVWGELATTITAASPIAQDVEPGDILQYRGFVQRVEESDGSTWTLHAEHHTSVVRAVTAERTRMCVYEQNVDGRRSVGTGYLDLAAMRSGTLWVYRPVPSE